VQIRLRFAQAQILAVVSHPAVESGANQLPVFVNRPRLAFADRLGILRPQPGFDAIHIPLGLVVTAPRNQAQNLVLPDPVGVGAGIGVFDRRKLIGLEHVHRAQWFASVVHGLKNRVGIAIVVGGYFNQAYPGQ